MTELDFESWAKEFKNPLWYLKLSPIWQKLLQGVQELPEEEKDRIKNQVADFVEQKLIAGEIALGSEIGSWDTERKPIDTIVIHHTSGNPGLSYNRLSAAELIRLYAPHYAANIKDKPISSGHVRNSKQIFWPYHWIIRTDGKYERLLEDDETGWQSGNWNVNCCSVAIVFDNDYENSTPSDTEIDACREIISKYAGCQILGHQEVNPKTVCPSNLFLGENGWKKKLVV